MTILPAGTFLRLASEPTTRYQSALKIMKRRSFILTSVFTIISPALAFASLGMPTPKVDITGRIVDIYKKGPAILLEDHHGLNRGQTDHPPKGMQAKTRRWLEGIRAPQAALFIKNADVARLRAGMTIRIKDYSYAVSSAGNGAVISYSVYYDKLEVLAVK